MHLVTNSIEKAAKNFYMLYNKKYLQPFLNEQLQGVPVHQLSTSPRNHDPDGEHVREEHEVQINRLQ